LTPFSHVQFAVLLQTFRVICILSTLGSTFTSLTYLLLKRSYKHVAVLLFAVGTMILSIVLLFGSIFGATSLYQSSKVCTIQGAILEFIGMWCVLWYSVVAISIRSQLAGIKAKNLKRFLLASFVTVTTASAVAAALPFFLKNNKVERSYQLVGLWCWIAPSTSLEMTLFYAWMFLSVLIAGGIWISILARIWRMKRARSEQQPLLLSNAVNVPRSAPLAPLVRHIAFLGFFAVIFFFMFAHRVFIYWKHRDYYALAFAHVVCLSSCGFIVFGTYGATSVNLRLWRAWFRGQFRAPQ